MLIVFWSPLGFSLAQILPKGHHFNIEYFCSHILHEIDRIRQATTDEDALRKIILHFDTAAVSLTFMDLHRMRRAPQPPFSPDLAPSDFYLFGKPKTTLMGSIFENEQELLDGIMRVLDRTARDELESVSEE
jgi:histone-lysine N-methyltransferase SETMAR